MEDIKRKSVNLDTKSKHGCKMYYKLAFSYNCVELVPYTLKTVRWNIFANFACFCHR